MTQPPDEHRPPVPPVPPPLPNAPHRAAPPLPPAAQPAPTGAPTASDREVQHVTEQTRTYPCGSCGASLVFDPAHQNLTCPSCSTSYSITLDPTATLTRHPLQTTVSQLRALAAPAGQTGNEHEVICQSCGGRTIFNGTLTATRCPYCATPIQRTDIQDSPERLAVDGILPLQVPEDAARSSIQQWINGRWFAPTEFKKYRTLGSFTSVYMSYFTYDANTVTQYTGRRGDDYWVTVGSGDNQHRERRTNWRSVSGVVHNQVRDLPEAANTGLDAGQVRELEPWPIQSATPYQPEFVAGHLSRTYDRDPLEVFEGAAKPRINNLIDSSIRRDIGGDHQQIGNKQTTFALLQFMYVLLPLWLLTVNFDGRPFQVLVNGLTGEVQGERPWSKVKIVSLVVTVILVIALIAVAIYFSQGG